MADFQFLQDPVSQKWVSLSPRRENRPNAEESKERAVVCPFCPVEGDTWLVNVLPNKFPFASIHELIIHSPDHHKSFGELPLDQIERILQTYKKKYEEYKAKGHVYIFHNSGEGSGASIAHPHTQLAVIPHDVSLDIVEAEIADTMFIDAGMFRLGTPAAAQWPDEVWFIPKATGKSFGEISHEEITSLSDGLDRLVKLYSHRYGHEFPFNFYIRPGMDWYLRVIPRVKSLGGFEVGTGVFVNTHDPKETVAFLREHWENPDFEKIKKQHKVVYGKHV